MKIYVGFDHYGITLSNEIKKILINSNIEFECFGPKVIETKYKLEDFIPQVCEKIQYSSNLGILICGTGIGVNIGANKFQDIRACLCSNQQTIIEGRSKDGMNILCLSARNFNLKELQSCIDSFLNTKFDNLKILQSFTTIDQNINKLNNNN